jgi:chromosome partitioning protein
LIVTIASTKGGPGKTTIAEIIVATLAADGIPVEAIDADPTDTLFRWLSNTYEGPPVPVHRETDPKALVPLMTAAAARVSVVVVDTAGFGNQAALVALVALVAEVAEVGASHRVCRAWVTTEVSRSSTR